MAAPTIAPISVVLDDVSGSGQVATPALLGGMLRAAEKISDLIFSPGRPPQVQVYGQMIPVQVPGFTVLTADDTRRIAADLIGDNKQAITTLRESVGRAEKLVTSAKLSVAVGAFDRAVHEHAEENSRTSAARYSSARASLAQVLKQYVSDTPASNQSLTRVVTFAIHDLAPIVSGITSENACNAGCIVSSCGAFLSSPRAFARAEPPSSEISPGSGVY